jgi:DNA-binding beta-propeller fold protein YncE
MTLELRGTVDLPKHPAGGFDHGDVDRASGRVFVAHTANGTVEVLDGVALAHVATIPGCPEASGVLCEQEERLTFAAARGGGKVLVVDSAALEVRGELPVGPKPNGLAWDPGRGRLLAADVEDFRARLVEAATGRAVASIDLSGRPRWCVYDGARDRFLINVRDPAVVDVLAAENLTRVATFPIPAPGPHGLDLDPERDHAFVACDGGAVVVLDAASGETLGSVAIAGEPDAIWFNGARRRLYVAIGKPGLIEVVDTEELKVVERVETEEGAHTTAFDPGRQQLYVFLPRSCRAAVYRESVGAAGGG